MTIITACDNITLAVESARPKGGDGQYTWEEANQNKFGPSEALARPKGGRSRHLASPSQVELGRGWLDTLRRKLERQK